MSNACKCLEANYTENYLSRSLWYKDNPSELQKHAQATDKRVESAAQWGPSVQTAQRGESQ